MADKTSASVQIRVIEVVAACLWVAAIGLLAVASVGTVPGGADMGRWALLIGMIALAATVWAIATWMVEVIRLEFELLRLSRPRSKGELRSIQRDEGDGTR
jgi:type VI protein secretion system component VasK